MTEETLQRLEVNQTEEITLHNADVRFYRDNAWIIFEDKKNPVPKDCFKVKEYPHYEIWQTVLKQLRKDGWETYIDELFAKRYKCLVPGRRWGKKEGLEFETEIGPWRFKIEFYQNLHISNPSGGAYDFNKYKMMPQAQKDLFEKTVQFILKFLQEEFALKIYDQSDIRDPPLTAEQQLLKIYHESGSQAENKIRSITEIESLMSDYDRKYNSISGVKDQLKCGEIRWFMSFHYGNPIPIIKKGTIFHHCNNMWWVIVDQYHVNAVASFEILGKVGEE